MSPFILPSIGRNLPLVGGVVLLVIVGKAFLIALTAFAFRRPLAHAVATGITLAQVGEFGIVIAGIGQSGDLIGDSLLKVLVSATLISLFLTPFLVRIAVPASWWVERMFLPFSNQKPEAEKFAENEAKGLENHVIVIGFGPAGQHAGEELSRVHFRFGASWSVRRC